MELQHLRVNKSGFGRDVGKYKGDDVIHNVADVADIRRKHRNLRIRRVYIMLSGDDMTEKYKQTYECNKLQLQTSQDHALLSEVLVEVRKREAETIRSLR